MADRYEINHDGEIVIGESALCADQTKVLQDLFSQYGWKCIEEEKEGSCHKLRLEHASCDSRIMYIVELLEMKVETLTKRKFSLGRYLILEKNLRRILLF